MGSVVRDWFEGRFAGPTPVQTLAWPAIARGDDVLVTAPTGAGKTFAAFFHALEGLVDDALRGELGDETRVVYVSPLKALSNDVQKNLEEPLAEIRALAAERGLTAPAVRVAVRTGDTPASERRMGAKKPPHILVTTPESLYILLTSESGRRALASVRTLILDEIHAVAADKRGAHLALSVERLAELVASSGRARPQRIGLSATVRPIEVASRLLVGSARPLPVVIDEGSRRELDLGIELPEDELGAVATNEQWEELYNRLAALIRAHTSTLVFVDTRRLVERVTHHLASRLGEGAALAHHGSLSRQKRLEAESKLKSGQAKVVVASASLELGIDVGAVDLACLVGSPRSIAASLQRIGRSGHTLGKTPKARLFPKTRDQLVECAAIVRGVRGGALDAIRLRQWPLDVLAQQMVAACASEPMGEDALFELVRRAAPYAELTRAEFDALVAMLSEGIATRRGRAGALLHHDAVNRVLRGRRGARLTAITSGGAIPDNANYDVVLEPDGTKIGTLDEDYAIESMAGDVFLLGNTSWKIRRVETGKVRVEDAKGAAPNIPFWLGEGPSRTPELSREVAELREWALSVDEAELQRACALDARGASLVRDYLRAGRAALGAIPTVTNVVAERFFDEAGGMQVVIHAPFGARINRAWGLALRKRFCRAFDFELQAAATDDGVLLSLGPQHSFPLPAIFEMLDAESVRELCTQAALQAPMFGTRWRWNATRSLALLRWQGGKKVPPPILRMRSDDLLAAVFPAQQGCQDNHGGPMAMEKIEPPDHPLVRETIRDCLTEAMDVEGLVEVLRRLADGSIGRVAIETPEPSVLSHEILNANPYAFLDDAPLEERRARAVSVRRGLPAEVVERVGGLDADAIEAVVAEARPRVRDADELHDLLLDLGALPVGDRWLDGLSAELDSLVAARRVSRLVGPRGAVWVAAERASIAQAAWRDARFTPELVAPPGTPGARPYDRDEAIVEIVRARLALAGPVTAAELGDVLGLPADDVVIAFARIELEGLAIRGRFRSAAAASGGGEVEMCDRRLLARIHRRTVDRLRRDIEPVTAAGLIRFLLAWQGVRGGSRRHGATGVAAVIAQLQGFEVAAGAWEEEVLPARVDRYEPGLLDALCLSGEAVWGRFAPRDAAENAPTRAAPITIARRGDLGWLLAPAEDVGDDQLGDEARAVLGALRDRGASFTEDLSEATGIDKRSCEEALWELVAAGRVTGDGFAGLRGLIGKARAPRVGRWWRPAAPHVAAGRWSLLRGSRGPAPAGGKAAEDALLNTARQYLARWGVVFKDVLAREPRAPAWRDLLLVYRRLEMQGEIRGGRFVEGFVGEQFATAEAVESMRAIRRDPARGEIVELSACDPLNLVGILTPGPRVPAVLGNVVAYRDGVPIAPQEPALGVGA